MTRLILLLVVLLASSLQLTAATWRVIDSQQVDEVPSAFPVKFSLLTHGEKHFVAYYNAMREMTVAACDAGQGEWTKQVLPSNVGWDSHNNVTLAVDTENQLHLSGNMHGNPLTRSRPIPFSRCSSAAVNRILCWSVRLRIWRGAFRSSS